ncbi:MAG: non-hydrolyzing UDP-N-acetylglucosamine 2-epimerase, partial [Armatimonadota bacterium]
GTNTLVGTNPAVIVSEALKVLNGRGKHGRTPEFWDGRAAERIIEILTMWNSSRLSTAQAA